MTNSLFRRRLAVIAIRNRLRAAAYAGADSSTTEQSDAVCRAWFLANRMLDHNSDYLR